MKILMLVDGLYPYTTANSGIAYRTAEVLQKEYGAEVLFLGMQTTPLSEVSRSRYRSWYLTADYRYRELIPDNLSRTKKFLRLLMHPSLVSFRLHRSFERKYPFRREYKKMLQKVLQEQPDIDCIISFSCPHDSIYAAAQAHGDIPLISYQVDPWSTHCLFKDDPETKKDEAQALRQCAALFVTKEMYREYKQGIYQPPVDRVIALEFPNLIPPPKVDTEKTERLEDGVVHCAYVGNLYDSKIRGPEYLFSLFRALKSDGVVLHIIGNTEAQAQQYRAEVSSNIVFHGRVSPEEAKAYMMSADILVNMGNVISNQLPSKTIDYIACGKPILNLCKIPNCPTIPYMEKYPLSLVVMEEDGINSGLINQVLRFCKESKGKNLSFDSVKELFYECTPECVGEVIYKTLKDIIKNKEE